MRKIVLYAVILGIFCAGVAHGGNIDCVKYLRFGDHKICMKTLKETSPALVAEIDGALYYASATPDVRRGVMFEYGGTDYSLYNRDDVEYELIHWLSGADELVNGVWRDKVAIGGAMDFLNHGCVWNDDHTGYYSSDGLAQYFEMRSTPTFDFGTDWYVEVTAQVGEPLGTICFLMDLASLTNTKQGTCAIGVSIIKESKTGRLPGQITNNAKPGANWSEFVVNTGTATYNWGDKTVFAVGYNRYSANKSRAFITWNGNRYYGLPFDTLQCNKWTTVFRLFRGYATQWEDYIYQCGPTTIYDVKVWRKK